MLKLYIKHYTKMLFTQILLIYLLKLLKVHSTGFEKHESAFCFQVNLLQFSALDHVDKITLMNENSNKLFINIYFV